MVDDVTVCIPTYKRPESLSMVLSRLLASTDRIVEILIGITGEEEDSLGRMREQIEQICKAFEIEGINVMVRTDLSGLMEAKQWFIDYATTEILLFLDDDAILGKDYLDLVDNFANDEVGAVSGVLQTPRNGAGYADWSDVPISVDDRYSNSLIYDRRRKTLQWIDKYQVYMHEENKIFDCEYLIGTALLVRKDLVEIDMEFQNGACGGEEIDFTYSIYQQGYKLWFDSSRVCWHLHENKGGMREKDRAKDQENFDYLVKKWGLGNGVEDRCTHYIKE
jgi:GT2 family glycosyltransferase